MTANPHIGQLLRELTLPKPYSVNAALAPNYKKAAAYGKWRIAARQEIMAQGPRLELEGPLFIEMIFPAAVR